MRANNLMNSHRFLLGLGVFLMLGFFLTPILYDVTIVPERFRRFYQLNPMTHLVDAFNRPGGPEANGLQILACGASLAIRCRFAPAAL